MFVTSKSRGYTRGGEQYASGQFLLIFDDPDRTIALDNGRTAPGLLAAVRFVRLRQLGHWMMGTAHLGGQSVTVSGSYGSDGLPMDVAKLTPVARQHLVPVPDALARRFWAGGGHNTSGSEGLAMRRWALDK